MLHFPVTISQTEVSKTPDKLLIVRIAKSKSFKKLHRGYTYVIAYLRKAKNLLHNSRRDPTLEQIQKMTVKEQQRRSVRD